MNKRDRKTILRASDEGLKPIGCVSPCITAQVFLNDGWLNPPRDLPTYLCEWRIWLGFALVEHKILNAPVIPRQERTHRTRYDKGMLPMFGDSLVARRYHQPCFDLVEYYFPDELLIWGCKEYVRRKRDGTL